MVNEAEFGAWSYLIIYLFILKPPVPNLYLEKT